MPKKTIKSKKAAPKKKVAPKKKAVPKKKAKGKRPADLRIQPKKEIDLDRLSDKRPWMLVDHYARRGRPAIYETADALDEACHNYFEWLNGIYYEKDVIVKEWSDEKNDMVDVKHLEIVWIRMPEPATITGLVLFLGFAHRSSLHEQMERGEDFSNVITRATHRVEYAYEKDLRDRDMSKGAQFALPNIGRRSGWSNTQAVQNLDKEGKPTDPPKQQVISITNVAPNLNKNL